MLLQRVKGSQESYSKQKSHNFSLAESLPGKKKKKKVLFIPFGLWNWQRVWEFPFLLCDLYLIKVPIN